MSAQHVANTWWACAKMGVDMMPATNSALQHAFIRVAPAMRAQNVASTWWALEKQQVMLFDDIVDDVLAATAAAAAKLNIGEVASIRRAVTSLGLAPRAAANASWQSGQLRFPAVK